MCQRGYFKQATVVLADFGLCVDLYEGTHTTYHCPPTSVNPYPHLQIHTRIHTGEYRGHWKGTKEFVSPELTSLKGKQEGGVLKYGDRVEGRRLRDGCDND